MRSFLPKSRRSSTAILLAASVFICQSAIANDDPAVVRGLQFLRARVQGLQVGETALTALAMLKADVPAGDPNVVACITKIRTRFPSGSYDPERKGGHDIYEAGCVAMALSNLSEEARRGELAAVAAYIVGRQNANGSWDYTNRQFGDTSISQYGVLGLWEAENGGAEVPPEVWDRAASWFMSVQAPGGSWNYHRDEMTADHPETVSMTAAGVGSLLICQRQLARYRKGGGDASALLTSVTGARQKVNYSPTTTPAKFSGAINRGIAWLSANFNTAGGTSAGQSAYYGLYGIERIGALADREVLGRINWFDIGRQYILTNQRNDGAWDSSFGDVANTVWAMLFLTKSTKKTIRRVEIKQLGAGTLLGGRGLPKDLTNLTVAGGRVVSRPMNGAVEGMLAVLEDPRSENANSALQGMVDRYRKEGPTVLRPHKDRFRKLLTDRDQGLRKVAAWALSRTGDLDVVPALIGALTDSDIGVVEVARDGLKLLSRKVDGLGPPSPSTPEQRQEAAKRWKAWYATIRPLELDGQDDDEPSVTAGGAAK